MNRFSDLLGLTVADVLIIVNGWVAISIAVFLESPAYAQYNHRAPAIILNMESDISFDPKVGLFASKRDYEYFHPNIPRNYLSIFPHSRIRPYTKNWNVFEAGFFFEKYFGRTHYRTQQNRLLQNICRNDTRRWKIGPRSKKGLLIERAFGDGLVDTSPYFYLDCKTRMVWTCYPGLRCTGMFFIANNIAVTIIFSREFIFLTPILIEDILSLKVAPAGLRPDR